MINGLRIHNFVKHTKQKGNVESDTIKQAMKEKGVCVCVCERERERKREIRGVHCFSTNNHTTLDWRMPRASARKLKWRFARDRRPPVSCHLEKKIKKIENCVI